MRDDANPADVARGELAPDFGKIATCIGLLFSVSKCGATSKLNDVCEQAKNEAFDALSKINAALSTLSAEAEAKGRRESFEEAAKIAESPKDGTVIDRFTVGREVLKNSTGATDFIARSTVNKLFHDCAAAIRQRGQQP